MDLETQTSEPMDTNNDLDLFADDDDMNFPDDQTSEAGEEVTEEPAQEVPAVEPQQTEQQTAPEETPFLDIVYNGQQISLTKEEAITLAQKGQNYDKKLQEIEVLKNSPERVLLQQLAQQSGMPYEQFLNSFKDQVKQTTLQVRAEQLMQTGVMDNDTALKLAQAELEKEELLNQRKAEEQKKNQFIQAQLVEQQKKAAFTKEFENLLKQDPEFPKRYPTFESLPEAMQEAIRNGAGITEAYQKVQIDELRNKVAAYEQNQKNKSMSPGSAISNNNGKSDPFLDVLFGDD